MSVSAFKREGLKNIPVWKSTKCFFEKNKPHNFQTMTFCKFIENVQQTPGHLGVYSDCWEA